MVFPRMASIRMICVALWNHDSFILKIPKGILRTGH